MIETKPSQTEVDPAAAKVLVVDDDDALARSVADLLTEDGYSVHAVSDPRRALEAFAEFSPDLVILDVLMPSLDGISLCLDLRRESDVPVLFLSAKAGAPDRVVGLRIGADDYVSKPFDNDELLARVGALLRRGRPVTTSARPVGQIRFGSFVIDSGSMQAVAGDHPLPLTPTEFKLLRALASEPGRVFTRDDLLSTVWGYAPGSDTRLVDVHVGRLRKKMQEGGVSEVAIGTSRGFGYRLTETTAQRA